MYKVLCMTKNKLMLFLKALLVLSMVVSVLTITGQPTEKFLSSKLLEADTNKDTLLLKEIFDEDILILYPDAPPFYGSDVALDLYEFIWSASEESSVDYIADNIRISGNCGKESGRYIYLTKEGVPDTISFEMDLISENGRYVIKKISYDNANMDNIVKVLPPPTGDYSIGRKNLLRKTDTRSRPIACQIWYPAQTATGKPALHQSREVTKASSDFLGMPLLWLSYFSLIETNTFEDALPVDGEKFPILLYNHGYGGFTSVYQTVFEELVSHGYVVVSIGHKDESALLIAEDGSVIPGIRDNPFYNKRQSELNGEEINRLQSIILNSDDPEDNKEAYKKLVKLSPLHKESVELWADDTKEVIKVLKNPDNSFRKLFPIFDFDRIGIFGHSVGGATAGQMAFDDPEVRAGINLDGFQFGDLVNNKLKIPFMFVSSNESGDRYLRAGSFMKESDADCYQATIQGTTHSDFSDLNYILRGDQRKIDAQRSLILSFFDKYLKGKDVKLTDMEVSYPHVVIKRN